jgi:clan AA aspartic protease
MITGIVKSRAACVRLRVRGPFGWEERIEPVIDTGYNGWLTLPARLITVLKLPWKTVARGTLADGSEGVFEVFEAQVVWDRRLRSIPVHKADTGPLIGMGLLKGYELRMQVCSRGKVTIKRLKS